MLFSITLSKLTLYVDEIIRDLQRGFQNNRSTVDYIFCIHQLLEKKWKWTVPQLFIDFKTAYNSPKKKVLYNIHTEFGIPMELVTLIKCVKRN
jgi:hypothetical protein